MGGLYKSYLAHNRNLINDEHTSTALFEYDGETYRVVMTRKRANRLSLIHCAPRAIVWEQLPFLYLRYNDRGRGEIIQNITVAVDKKYTTIFVIKGKPRSILGLDEGVYRSANNFDKSYINVMSEKRFKTLQEG